MELNDLRSAVTVFSLLIFFGIVAWAYAGRNRKRFDDMAMLPLVAEDGVEAHTKNERDAA